MTFQEDYTTQRATFQYNYVEVVGTFQKTDDINLRTSLVLTFLSSKRREPSISWKNIAFPWYGSAPAVFVFLLLNDPIRHYFPDRGRLN